MKKIIALTIVLILLMPYSVNAKRGCCSWHGGESGACSTSGKEICNDGTESPSCTCESAYSAPTYVYGCIDKTAKNYNSSATKSDGSCIYYIYGCTDSTAINYAAKNNTDDNSCKYQKEIKEVVAIKYKKTYTSKGTKKYSNGTVIIKGQNGSKELTYTVITNKNGTVLSKKKKSEVIIKKATNQVVYKKKK